MYAQREDTHTKNEHVRAQIVHVYAQIENVCAQIENVCAQNRIVHAQNRSEHTHAQFVCAQNRIVHTQNGDVQAHCIGSEGRSWLSSFRIALDRLIFTPCRRIINRWPPMDAMVVGAAVGACGHRGLGAGGADHGPWHGLTHGPNRPVVGMMGWHVGWG